jgi:hypothetical protein
MDRLCGTTQADGLSALQSGWHIDSPRLFAWLRRRRLPTQDHSRSADFLQQPPSTPRLWSHLQRLDGRQNPTPERHRPRAVAISATRRRRQHRRGMPWRRRLPAQRPHLATHLETLRPGPKQNPHGALGLLSAARSARGIPPTRNASPRPSPSRLSRLPLSDRRLPTFHANLLRLSRRPPSTHAERGRIPSALRRGPPSAARHKRPTTQAVVVGLTRFCFNLLRPLVPPTNGEPS